jgi:peroxiredoxin
MAPEVGTEAPDFTLKDQNNQEVTLSSFRGERNVLLVFYPFAFSGICTGELCQLRDELATYTDAGVRVLAISTDIDHTTVRAFRETHRFFNTREQTCMGEGLGLDISNSMWFYRRHYRRPHELQTQIAYSPTTTFWTAESFSFVTDA